MKLVISEHGAGNKTDFVLWIRFYIIAYLVYMNFLKNVYKLIA